MSTNFDQFMNISKKLSRILIAILITGIFTFGSFSSSAFAGGSIALSSVNEKLTNKSTDFKQQIKQALKDVKKDDVDCVAETFSRSSIRNVRIAPFSCEFAKNKTLTIEAKNLVKYRGKTISLDEFSKSVPKDASPSNTSFIYELKSWKFSN